MASKKLTQADLDEYKADLRKLFPKGSTVYTVLRHLGRSGTSRDISVLSIAAHQGGEVYPLHPSVRVAAVLGYRVVDRHGDYALRVGGGGMDMGFHIAHSLGLALYGDGYALNHRWL